MTARLEVKVIGTGLYGPPVITIGDREIVARINPASELRRFRCSVHGVGESVNHCPHLQFAALARELSLTTPIVKENQTNE
ncbi:hypothetical protein MLP_30460 [Microlunatus phosphovorus NM-1]|uniref:Uncharacterized protein n=1 Tax=Microlunatus phosphovorus (strain ATCC 700054 / DSM 10555 / JCM 9379 / NBRC 101784 / NCIMB 13414 / VKM Ac-1990 / NM-1) TaxID=1032480 RepID=F5XKI8_MICPN|nr:hypothetical protein [Microlunatus phosphovorus]BAK36060.1 hypothetical protein MLP_30460 [Microlunatus phosphovorus NM-1]